MLHIFEWCEMICLMAKHFVSCPHSSRLLCSHSPSSPLVLASAQIQSLKWTEWTCMKSRAQEQRQLKNCGCFSHLPHSCQGSQTIQRFLSLYLCRLCLFLRHLFFFLCHLCFFLCHLCHLCLYLCHRLLRVSPAALHKSHKLHKAKVKNHQKCKSIMNSGEYITQDNLDSGKWLRVLVCHSLSGWLATCSWRWWSGFSAKVFASSAQDHVSKGTPSTTLPWINRNCETER